MLIGAQLYTVEKFCRNLDDLAETLKKVADIGYTTVQLSGVCPYEPEWVRDELKKNGKTTKKWVLRDSVVTSALIGASRPQQIIENVEALKGPAFTADELAAIETILG